MEGGRCKVESESERKPLPSLFKEDVRLLMAVRSRVAVGVDIRIEWGGGERRAFGRLAMSLSCLRSLLITSTDNQIGKLESNKFSLLSQTLTLLSLKGVHLLLSSGKSLICESLSELSFSGWQTVLLHLIRFELCLS